MAGRPASLRLLAATSRRPVRPRPIFEYVSPHVFDSRLRRELTSPEATLKDGRMDLPQGAGLGIELNEDLVQRLRVD